MLNKIPKVLSPELLKILCEMGHGDEIVIADANFPSASMAKNLVRADGIPAGVLLEAILELFPLDRYDKSHFVLMEKCPQDTFHIDAWDEYKKILDESGQEYEISYMERFAYYERAKKAYAVLATGEEQLYANIILKKGCVK